MPQFDWLCDKCEYVMSPTLGIYWASIVINPFEV